MAVSILENNVKNREWDSPNASAHFPVNLTSSMSALSFLKVFSTADLSSLQGARSISFKFAKLYQLHKYGLNLLISTVNFAMNLKFMFFANNEIGVPNQLLNEVKLSVVLLFNKDEERFFNIQVFEFKICVFKFYY